MKNAFTMIELIFVVVILGILAAVAIPRMSATREDAIDVRMAHSIMTGAGEIASYAMAQGRVEDDLAQMSNALSSLVSTGDAVSGSKEVDVKRGGVSDCVTVRVISGTNEENLTLLLGNAGGDPKCAGLQRLIDTSIYPMMIRGVQIEY